MQAATEGTACSGLPQPTAPWKMLGMRLHSAADSTPLKMTAATVLHLPSADI